MQYTSDLKKLVLPEYGRNVQQMVDHCMTIEDRAERTRCANTIINIMGNLFPHLRDIEDSIIPTRLPGRRICTRTPTRYLINRRPSSIATTAKSWRRC